MRKIIVTGATSFIATHLLNELLNNGDFIYAVIRPNSSNTYRLPIHNRLKIIELDLKNIEYLPDYVNEDIDMIYHLAWEGIRGEERNDLELQKRNYIASLKLIKAAKQLKISLFIGSGSQAEYGIVDGPVYEEQIEKPFNQYGIYKLKTKQECEAYAENNDMKFIWVRIFSAYGKYDYNNSLIMSCIEKMKHNEEIPLTQCFQKWDYIYVGDIAKALLLFSIRKCESGTYNVASGQTRILKDYIIELKEILHSSSDLKFGMISYGSQGIVNLEPNIHKIVKALKWNPETSFKEGINKTILNI